MCCMRTLIATGWLVALSCAFQTVPYAPRPDHTHTGTRQTRYCCLAACECAAAQAAMNSCAVAKPCRSRRALQLLADISCSPSLYWMSKRASGSSAFILRKVLRGQRARGRVAARRGLCKPCTRDAAAVLHAHLTAAPLLTVSLVRAACYK